jgi:hypothetical protein
LIQLARYFDDSKPLEKISITAAYEISAPINADIADEIYESVRGKNMPVTEVKRQIALKKGTLQTVKAEATTQIEKAVVQTDDEIVEKAVELIEESVKNETVKIEIDLESQFMALAKTVSAQVAISVMQKVIKELSINRYPSK